MVALFVVSCAGFHESLVGQWSWSNSAVLIVHCYFTMFGNDCRQDGFLEDGASPSQNTATGSNSATFPQNQNFETLLLDKFEVMVFVFSVNKHIHVINMFCLIMYFLIDYSRYFFYSFLYKR